MGHEFRTIESKSLAAREIKEASEKLGNSWEAVVLKITVLRSAVGGVQLHEEQATLVQTNSMVIIKEQMIILLRRGFYFPNDVSVFGRAHAGEQVENLEEIVGLERAYFHHQCGQVGGHVSYKSPVKGERETRS